MDFAALMSAEISKSKSAVKPPASPSPTTSLSSDQPPSKYLKRSDLETQRIAAYEAEQARLEADRISKLAQKRKFEDEEADRRRERDEKKRKLAEESRRRREEEEERKERARRKRLGLPELVEKGEGEKEGTPAAEGEEDVEDEVLLEKLRALGEPARLFGESHRSRLRRWRRLVRSATPTQCLSSGPIPTTLALLEEKDMKVPAAVPTTPEARSFLFRQLASYFTMVLREWDFALSRREQVVKESFQGKQAYGAMVQSRENMRPLFKKFERGEVEEGILAPMVEIVKAAQERRYVDANDGYLRLSIGKA